MTRDEILDYVRVNPQLDIYGISQLVGVDGQRINKILRLYTLDDSVKRAYIGGGISLGDACDLVGKPLAVQQQAIESIEIVPGRHKQALCDWKPVQRISRKLIESEARDAIWGQHYLFETGIVDPVEVWRLAMRFLLEGQL